MATGVTSSALLGQGIYSGGWNSARGHGKIDLSVDGLVRPGGALGMPQWAEGPSRETLFDISGIDALHSPYTESGETNTEEFKITPCICVVNSGVSTHEQRNADYLHAFTKNIQRGYKTRTTDSSNLKTNMDFPNQSKSTELESLIDKQSEQPGGVPLADIINEEYSTYKYGYRLKASNQGRDLPGPLTATLLKGGDVGPAIWTTKRYGWQPNGRYAGYQQAQTNASGLVYTGYQ
jgi:hypothetical protein